MNAEQGVHLVPEGHGGLTVASERLSAITGAVPRRAGDIIRTRSADDTVAGLRGTGRRRPRALAPR
jgi:hypothetical protein